MKPEKNVKNVKATRERIPKKKGYSTLVIGIIAVVLLAGIAIVVLSGDSTPKKTGLTLKEARALIDEEYGRKFPDQNTNTPPVRNDYTPILSPRVADKLPSYAYTNPMTLKAYKYATEHPEILEQIPCYCGCGGHSGHRFLRDCYIHDDGTYDDHASFCDVCIGEAIKVQEYLASGTSTATTQKQTSVQPQSTDLSALSLPGNFKSLSDGLKLIPPGIRWAYFANLKQGVGIEQNFMPPTDFYGAQVIGMLNSEYYDGSWVELHDIGKTDTNVKSNSGEKNDNILYTRPYIFDTKDKTNSVFALFKDSATNPNAYNSFKSLLEKVDDENAGFAKINTNAPSFADLSYFGLIRSGNDVKGEIAFHIKDNGTILLTKYNELKNSSVGRGFKSYEVTRENNTLIISMVSNLNNVISEAKRNYGIEI